MIADILENKHHGTPKVFAMSDLELTRFCAILLKHLWFSGGLFELHQKEHLLSKWNRQIKEIAKKENK